MRRPVEPLVARAFAQCEAASTLADACFGLVDDLYAWDLLPSVYFLVDGRLRCQAARGYFQVVDGFTPGRGVIGSVTATGEPVFIHDVSADPTYIAAIPDVVGEACVPVRVHGEIVGAVNVEWMRDPAVHVMSLLNTGVERLAAKIEDLGGMPPVSLAQRLARIAVEMAALTDAPDIVRKAVEAAIEISGRTSAALSQLTSGGRWSVAYATGPLATPLSQWSDEDYRRIADWGAPGTSSYFPGGEVVPSGYDSLLRAGVKSIAVQPLFLSGTLVGLLATADTRPTVHDPSIGAAVELLATQTAAALAVASAIDELSERTVRDPLTKLRNAGAFRDDMERAAVLGDTACLLIDVDHFKTINDTHGHLVGDRLLCDLAEQLAANLREDDVLYRIGGDEFAAILRRTSAEQARGVATRLVEAAHQVNTTVSVGMAMVGEAGPVGARRSADLALYQAKGAGRDRLVVAGSATSGG